MAIINDVSLGFEREPLIAPLGFKGGYVNNLWQIAVLIKDDLGREGLGLGLQSVLWSDSSVFTAFTTTGGNSAMLMITEYALKLLRGQLLRNPIEMLLDILPDVHEYGKQVTGFANMKMTFTLNALVAVDMALWRLYCNSFDEILPNSERQNKLASIPTIAYGLSGDQIKQLADDGMFFMKIKIGNNPEWDMERISQIHDIFRDRSTEYTDNGKIPYYIDANCRYNSKESLLRLIDHADKIGALQQIVLFEEPFPEELEIDVSDIPLRLVADESAHSVEDCKRLIDMGYSSFALKPIAKTLSMSLLVLEKAYAAGLHCFCADLTVNPLMVDWNKNLAARLGLLSGVKVGFIETNGHQNYKNWERMVLQHPANKASWIRENNGLFELNDDFYQESGGIFQEAPHYRELALS